jgi:UDP-glucose-4-epimerase GalE
MATVLVTGGAGYVGCHVLLPLIEHGHQPIVLDNLSRGHRSMATLHPSIVFVEGELKDRALIRDTLKRYSIDAVMHYAALAYVEESTSIPDAYYQTNSFDTLGLLEELIRYRPEAPPPFVFSSSCAVFGTPASLPVTEQIPKDPISPYGRSKLMAEWLLEDVGRSAGLSTVLLRYFNAAGADFNNRTGECHAPETHLIPLAIRAARSHQPFLIHGSDFPTPDGTAVRDFVHVRDLASAHIAALNYLLAGGKSDDFNLGSGLGHSVLEVVHAIERITATKLEITRSPRRLGDPAALVCDPSKARKILQWVPQYSDLDVIVHDAAAWDSHLYSNKEVPLV